ncbi:unnamed protein product [Aspergillus oryzae RIB40]|uniref:DNA, SC005 n=2 Tax=Aspergillus oryzae TaxID=5062 RepID=Q2URB9_ASPOR|nr:unnamed protein product [Aspergillus oryzae RIB40]EIT80059.1 hypothetical protein Ao3042_03414 [Aspergillus oryzae 3.042]KDE81550.1 hypothetical protein AO1008_08129 [Aspergillus oryzae 100-8]BAE55896.1 unnamed protein product [Aspergillus oryzae RIB40]|eukprot:EIT80059.1 hypothetical protein Ao3042_03414 [Aspergillus oryzae 3.042]
MSKRVSRTTEMASLFALIWEEVTKWLIANFVVLSLGQEISSFEGLSDSHAQVIDSVVVTECSGEDMESGAYRLQQVELDVQAYQLRAAFEQESSQQTQPLEESMDSKDEDSKARVLNLPSRELDGLWESLLFDQPLKSMLLRAITRMGEDFKE